MMHFVLVEVATGKEACSHCPEIPRSDRVHGNQSQALTGIQFEREGHIDVADQGKMVDATGCLDAGQRTKMMEGVAIVLPLVRAFVPGALKRYVQRHNIGWTKA